MAKQQSHCWKRVEAVVMFAGLSELPFFPLGTVVPKIASRQVGEKEKDKVRVFRSLSLLYLGKY